MHIKIDIKPNALTKGKEIQYNVRFGDFVHYVNAILWPAVMLCRLTEMNTIIFLHTWVFAVDTHRRQKNKIEMRWTQTCDRRYRMKWIANFPPEKNMQQSRLELSAAIASHIQINVFLFIIHFLWVSYALWFYSFIVSFAVLNEKDRRYMAPKAVRPSPYAHIRFGPGFVFFFFLFVQ